MEPTPASVEANLAHFQPNEAQAPHWIELAGERIGLVVLRAEYRTFDLSETPLLELDKRFSAGVGISF